MHFLESNRRVRVVNDQPERPTGAYVLYWMIASRRTRYNFGLQRAVSHAERLDLPLLIFEPLRCGHRWASQRIHRFVLDGMADNAERLRDRQVAYYPWLEREAGEGKGLLRELASRAAIVVTDLFPCFFLPRMVQAAGAKIDVMLEEVDGNGIVPLSSVPKTFSRAFDFRRFLQREISPHLDERPSKDPLGGRPGLRGELEVLVDPAILGRWPPVPQTLLDGDSTALDALPVDAAVPPVSYRGGSREGEHRLRMFLDIKLSRYGERNQPDQDVVSDLSPYLHFGHVSAHELVGMLLDEACWSAPHPPLKVTGARSGWWGLSAAQEGFLDQVLTWRELGYTDCFQRPDHAEYESLPEWARRTMDEHRGDERPELYTLEQLEAAQTSDEIWNAAQRQLRTEGRIHNYLRMLWGKRIYEWSPSPEEAWRRLEHLNNRWALDGRNPNSYSGLGWVMGRFDRAWGPERPIFGKLRYMTSGSTRRKLKLSRYLQQWGTQSTLF